MKRGRFWFGIAVSLLCLALALKDVHLAEVATALGGANYAWVAVTVLITAFGLWTRALRWRLLFFPLKALPLNHLFAVVNIGYLLNNVLPARLGDVARAYLIGDLTGVSKARALSTIFLERVVDVLIIIAFLAGLTVVMPLPDWAASSGVVLGLGFCALAVLLVVLPHQRDRALSVLRWVVGRVPFLDRPGLWRLAESLLDGMEVLRFPRPAAQLVVGSIFIWILSALQFYVTMLAFDMPLPPTAAVFVLCVTALGMTVPSSPGYIGVWEYLIIMGLSLFQVDKSIALSYALVLHFAVYLTTTAMGVLSLWKESLGLSLLQEKVKSEVES